MISHLEISRKRNESNNLFFVVESSFFQIYDMFHLFSMESVFYRRKEQHVVRCVGAYFMLNECHFVYSQSRLPKNILQLNALS